MKPFLIPVSFAAERFTNNGNRAILRIRCSLRKITEQFNDVIHNNGEVYR